MQDFTEIWNAAKAAANAAAIAENERLGSEERRGFDCGFAWITMSGNIPFARWAKAQGLASKGYPSGYQIWYSKIHDVPTQSVSVHEAACRVAAQSLQRALSTSLISSASRLD